MKRVIRYKTIDGRLFKSEENARKHEQIIEDVEAAVRLILPKRLDTLAFVNGDGFIQVGAVVLKEFALRFEEHFDKFHDGAQANSAALGRVLNDSGSPSYRLWSVSQQIDKQGRLWGQKWLAANPEDGKQVQLNK